MARFQPVLTYLTLTHRAGDLDRSFSVLEEMVLHGIAPDVITYTILIKVCGKTGKVERAEELFRTMQQRTNHFSSLVLPSEKTFAELMHANINGRITRGHSVHTTSSQIIASHISCARVSYTLFLHPNFV